MYNTSPLGAMLVRSTVSWLIMVFGSGNLSMKCVETCTASWARYYFHLFPSFWAFKTYPACKSTPYVHHYIQYKDTTHNTTRLPVPMQYACWSTLMSRLGNIEMVCLYYVYLMFVVVHIEVTSSRIAKRKFSKSLNMLIAFLIV